MGNDHGLIIFVKSDGIFRNINHNSQVPNNK